MTPILLPLVTKCPAAMLEGVFGDPNAPILQAQMETLGGQVYLVPLSVEAARGLLVMLANWPPMQDYLSGQELPEPRKPQ